MGEPASEDEIRAMIEEAESAMDKAQRRLWGLISIEPQKWAQSPWGDDRGGFWAVAVLGHRVLWFNDLEEGFNISSYGVYGTIAEYWCNEDPLEVAVQELLGLIETGRAVRPRRKPPKRAAPRAR